MKRYGNLWPQIIDFANLEQAARQAQRGKRQQANVLAFNFNLENELLRLQRELAQETYKPGPYTTFHIYEPKKRMISAAPYRDRVAHHALCNVIGPIFEKTFIHDSYANRVSYGTHRALRRFTQFARSSKYVLQCDIRQYFPSIDHEILKELLRRKIKCRPTLRLMDTIIDASNPQDPALFYFPGDDILAPLMRRRGLPIGNLTSQFFANIYLNGFDHFIKERLGVAKYLRYVDDFALFSDDRSFLADARLAIEDYLSSLRLKIHPVKSQLFETRRGANFVGFRVLPEQIRVRAENLRRARRRLRGLRECYRAGKLELTKLRERLISWQAHLAHGNTWRLRETIFTRLVFARG
jgi:retron-type reverse transcriptase